MAVQAVVFDIGNVLIEWVPERYFDRVYGEEMRKRLFEEVDLHGM
ncbi:MAG: 2-haloacid dehalogenase, partial [Polaromonas sp.]